MNIDRQDDLIYQAIREKDVAQVRHLLELDPMLALIKNPVNDTPLHIAAEEVGVDHSDLRSITATRNLLQIAEILLDFGAEVDPKGHAERTPLHYAAILGHVAMAELCLAGGADLNAQDQWGMTPLCVAITEEPLVEDHLSMVEFLLSKGADPNIASEGVTPLDVAVYSQDDDIIQVLLAHGAQRGTRSQAQSE